MILTSSVIPRNVFGMHAKVDKPSEPKYSQPLGDLQVQFVKDCVANAQKLNYDHFLNNHNLIIKGVAVTRQKLHWAKVHVMNMHAILWIKAEDESTGQEYTLNYEYWNRKNMRFRGDNILINCVTHDSNPEDRNRGLQKLFYNIQVDSKRHPKYVEHGGIHYRCPTYEEMKWKLPTVIEQTPFEKRYNRYNVHSWDLKLRMFHQYLIREFVGFKKKKSDTKLCPGYWYVKKCLQEYFKRTLGIKIPINFYNRLTKTFIKNAPIESSKTQAKVQRNTKTGGNDI